MKGQVGDGHHVAEVLPRIQHASRLHELPWRPMRLKMTPWSCRGSAQCMAVVATVWDVPLLTLTREQEWVNAVGLRRLSHQPCSSHVNSCAVYAVIVKQEKSAGINASPVLNAYCRLPTTSVCPLPRAFAPYAGLASNGTKVVQSMSDFFGDQHVLDQQVLGVYPQVDTSTSLLSENEDS